MRFVDILTTALRGLRRQKLRSALTIFAVVIGAASVTIMLALVTGARDFFVAQFEATGQLQQVVVTQATDLDYDHARFANSGDSGVKLTDDLAKQIAALPHVAAVARNASPYVFAALRQGEHTLSVNNTQASDANGVVVHPMLAGREFTPDDGAGTVLISQQYADKLGFTDHYGRLVGQQVTLVTREQFTGEGATIPPPRFGPGNNAPGNNGPGDKGQQGNNGPGDKGQQGNNGPGDKGQQGNNGPGGDNQPAVELTATVLGVVAGDEPTLYFPLSWAHGLAENRRYDMTDTDRHTFEQAQRNRQPGAAQPQPHFTLIVQNELDQRGYNSFTVKADRVSDVEAVATEIRALGVGASTARSFVDEQLKVFAIVSYVLGGIGGIALLVAAIGVINTMLMATLERTREIGVLRACGATRATVRRLFTVEAGLLGFWGGVFGVLAGFGLTRIANAVINRQLTANSVNAHDIVGVAAWLVVAVILTTTVIGVFAGLYPAARASRLNPVEALRHE
jgi:ABC-type lipoprotein release transport system permease subunit